MPEYSITISPASMFRLQNSPRPWMADLRTVWGGRERERERGEGRMRENEREGEKRE